MTAALELAGFSPEVVEALVEHLAAKLVLVPPAPASTGLSMLRTSIDRRNCERRQADAVRGDRSEDGLSKIPASVRRREWARRRAAAKKASFDRFDRPPLDLQPVDTEKKHSLRSPSDRSQSGPLAGDLAQIVDRVSGYADSNRLRERAWLYREAARIFGEELGLRLPERWSGAKDWGAAKALIRDWKPEEILAGIKVTCAKWKRAPGTWSRPTLGLVLFHLKQERVTAPPVPPTVPTPDSRRLTGEQLEARDRKRARAAMSSPRAILPETETATKGPRADGELVAGVDGLRTCREDRAEEAHQGAGGNGRSIAPSGQRGSAEGGPPTPAAAAKPLQIAEPSPATSAEALAVLDLVNATAARCRAFRGRP